MSDEPEQKSETEEVVIQGEPVVTPKKGLPIKLILIILVPLLLIGGGAAVLFLTPFGHKILHKEIAEGDAKESAHTVYYDMPELLVNLNSPEKKRTNFLRLVLKLEVSDADAFKTLDSIKPRIIDQFQVYLRELRPEDLQGSAGIQRLREELLKRVNAVSTPVKVRNVLFETKLVQ